MHLSFKRIYVLERNAANCKGRVEHKYFVGRLISDLQPCVILNVHIRLTVPSFYRVAVLVDLSARLQERSSSEDNFPSQYFPKGQQESSSNRGQVMAISLSIISQPPSLNPCKPSIIDSLMNQVFQIKLLVNNFGALLLH